MTPNTSTSESILVRGIGMDTRKEAVFRMAFKMFTRRSYRLLEAGDERPPTLAIVDIDGPEGTLLIEQFQREYPGRHILLTSISPLPDSMFPVLQKPVRMETLFPALDLLLSKAPPSPMEKPSEKSGATVTPIRPQMEVPAPSAPSISTTATARPTAAAPSPPLSPRPVPALRPEEIRRFDAQTGLLGQLQIIRRDQAAAVIVEDHHRIILRIDPVVDQVVLLTDDEHLRSLVRDPQARLQMRAPSNHDIPANTPTRHLTLQSLLWQVAAWSADGRLSQHLQMNAPVQLKQWPNLTRLVMLPDALRLAAFLARSPASPALTIKVLRVAPADLFNFLAAADSLGLLRYDTAEKSENSILTTAHSAPAHAEIPSAKRSFLGRILARIAGL